MMQERERKVGRSSEQGQQFTIGAGEQSAWADMQIAGCGGSAMASCQGMGEARPAAERMGEGPRSEEAR